MKHFLLNSDHNTTP